MVKKLGLLFLIAVTLASCASKKDILYFQSSNTADSTQSQNKNFETVLKSDDLLMIVVSADNMGSVEKFNPPIVGTTGTTAESIDQVNVQMKVQTYLVDKNGEINFPVLGKIKVGGLRKSEVVELLIGQLTKYVSNPVINLRIVNYKISVIGEVVRPGEQTLLSERITIPEALSRAGDLTIYGDRKNILLLRDIDGVQTRFVLDLTSNAVINSPYYYLQQNDVLYVQPNKTRVNSSVIGPNTGIILSGASLLLATLALILR